jgi:hypothetical protein
VGLSGRSFLTGEVSYMQGWGRPVVTLRKGAVRISVLMGSEQGSSMMCSYGQHLEAWVKMEERGDWV